MRASALKYTKDVIIDLLKGFLANYENYQNFCEIDFSHAMVYDKEPNELRSFPLAIVSGSNGQVITGGLQDFAHEIHNQFGDLVAYRYGGMYEFNITIDLGTRSTFDRELFSDLIAMALRVHLRRHIEREGIIIKDMRYGGEAEIPYDSDKVYASSIQFTTWSEWYKDIDLLDIADINLNFNRDLNNP
ncbi:gp177 [Bacillus phage G]|uniref:Gp177 n=1 Tax=Bacillus phage G TaxID=2884420 RepID=G3MBP3_9CAUD|nr:gp177 [Bacillus phage G]AEO93437.1 gp177 [Bacillus phage G]